MRFYVLLPVISEFILGYLLLSLIRSRFNSSLKKAFIKTLCLNLLWNGFTLFEWWPGQSRENAFILSMLKMVVMPFSFLFSLQLLYTMVQKKKDIAFHVSRAVFLAIVFLILVLIITGHPPVTGMVPSIWGYTPLFISWYVQLYIGLGVYVLIYMSYVLFTTMKRTSHELVVKQLKLVLVGILLSGILYFFIALIFSYILKLKNFPNMTSVISVVGNVYIYLAVYRYKFITPDLVSELDEVFSRVDDSVIIMNHEGVMVGLNRSARDLFGIWDSRFSLYLVAELVGPVYNFDEDFKDKSVTLKERRFVMNQFSLFTEGIIQGKALFLKDVTHLTEAEARIRELNAILTARAEASDEKLQEANSRILEQQYKEEIANVTTLTLHNVQNVMSTVRISSELIMDFFSSTAIVGFKKANALLRANINNLEEFIIHDERGRLLLEYYLKLEEILDEDQRKAFSNFERLEQGLVNADRIIATQQGYGHMDRLERVSPQVVIEDALTILSGTIRKKKVEVCKNYETLPSIMVQKAKFIHILLNLIKNAIEAMAALPEGERVLTILTEKNESHVFIKIRDRGKGIAEEEKINLFSMGFTTKENGHGFGLYSCMLYIKEMEGELEVFSTGEGEGAEFLIKLPCR